MWRGKKRTFREFVIRAGIFTLGFLAIFGLMNAFYYYRVTRQDAFSILFNRFLDDNLQPRVMLLGDSHTALDIRSQYLPDGYLNFTILGEDWKQLYLRAITAIRHKKGITHFVIPLEYHLFAPYRAKNEFFTNYLRFSDLEDIREVFQPSPATLFKARVAGYLPLVSPSNRNRLRQVIGEDLAALLTDTENIKAVRIDEWGGLVPTDDRAWSELPLVTRNTELNDRIQKHFADPLIAEELYDVFERFLELAQREGVQVIGVRYPLTVAYKEEAAKFNLAELDERYASLQLSAVLDYRDLFDDHQDYFRDQDHLNEKGAHAFSPIIAKDLASIIK